jgi:hypothetical protein
LGDPAPGAWFDAALLALGLGECQKDLTLREICGMIATELALAWVGC